MVIFQKTVPWGKVKKEGVLLGFVKGHLLRDEMGYLEKGDRKQVYTKTFHRKNVLGLRTTFIEKKLFSLGISEL
jgi:hypothetical protein